MSKIFTKKLSTYHPPDIEQWRKILAQVIHVAERKKLVPHDFTVIRLLRSAHRLQHIENVLSSVFDGALNSALSGLFAVPDNDGQFF